VAHDRKKEPTPSVKSGARTSTSTGPAFQHYQSAVQLLQQGKFEKAQAGFE
jgi:TolA-binding protein